MGKNIYCVADWALRKAYRCVTCKKAIVPAEGQKTAPRLRALGKDYHPDCFKCEDCGLLLDTRKKGRECYPHKDHIYCLKCNRKHFSSSEEDSSDGENWIFFLNFNLPFSRLYQGFYTKGSGILQCWYLSI